MSTTTTDATATTAGTKVEKGAPTSAQLAAYLHTASHMVAAQMGLNPQNLTYEDRLKYNRALAIVITTYPTRFSKQAVVNAQDTLKKNFTPLEDTGFDISAFGSAVVDNGIAIGMKVANAANSGLDAVSNTFAAFKYALPVLAVAGLALFIWVKTTGKVPSFK